MRQVIFLTLAIFVFAACKKNKTKNCYTTSGKGRIIGYHPCANYFQANHIYGAGFVVEIDKTTTKDTMVTFQIPEGSFTFKPEYIDGSYSLFLFRPEVQDMFKIKFTYKVAVDNEKTNIVCNGMINTAPYDAAVRNREIFVSCISKQ
ncbi:MAG: hypothetical protein ACTHK0_17485 [Ginsengibacter sp.]